MHDHLHERIDRVVVLGYISAVSMPPIGFVLAIAIGLGKTRGSRKHAWLIGALGIIACLMWTLIIASGAFTATDNGF